MADLHASIEDLWGRRDDLDPADADAAAVVHEAIDLLDRGEARVAEVVAGEVVVHEWLKQAILLLFRQSRMATQELGPFEFADKVPLKSGYEDAGVRVCLVINATRPKQLAGGTFGLPCALVIKRFAEGERHDKAALNAVLREHGVAT
jgi:2,3,4,5-tetrahydropyridine-2,6-dicarboxylate N-succinyltransferase